MLLGLVSVGSELDPAGLAAPAREDLGLDDDRPTEHLGRLPRLTGRRRQPAIADWDPNAPEQLLTLVFVEIHSAPSLPARFAGQRTRGAELHGRDPVAPCIEHRLRTAVLVRHEHVPLDRVVGETM